MPKIKIFVVLSIFYIILLISLGMLTGCWDTQAPPGTVGTIIGCIEAENSVYCITEYPNAPVSLESVVDDVMDNGLRYEHSVITVSAPIFAINDGWFWIETGTDGVDMMISNAADVWKAEAKKTYKLTMFIESINRDRGEYEIWAYPVADNRLANAEVQASEIVTNATAGNTTDLYTALNVKGTVLRHGDKWVSLQTQNDVRFSVYTSDPEVFAVGSVVVIPIFIRSISEQNGMHYITTRHIKRVQS